MGFLDDIFGKKKLVKEIEQFQEKIKILERELKEKNNSLKNLYASNEKLKEEKKILDKTLDRSIVELEHAKDSITTKIKESVHAEKVMNLYQGIYGELEYDEGKEQHVLSDYDEDKGFFDFLKPKNDNNDFNNEQIEAIRYDMEKNLRIIAGAGSGKTQTICAKTAYLIMMKNVPEEKIAMITFTKKASEEMKERVNFFLDEEKSKVAVGTFHSFFIRLYNELKKQFPYVEQMGIIGDNPDESSYKNELNKLIRVYNLKKLDENAGEKNLFEKISYWTNMGFSIEMMTKYIEKHFNVLEPTSDETLSQRFQKMMREFYDKRKSNKIVVFDDYMLNLLHVLKDDIQAREYVQKRFQYIFIDEFQDTNPLQMDIIKLICPPDLKDGAKLIIVGDDDQSIYYFRGAEPKYIKDFDQMYETQTLKLMTNYRSTSKIVQAGNRVIAFNENNRIKKSMKPFHKNEGDCYIQSLSNPEEEAEWIIDQSHHIGLSGNKAVPDYRESVILYRSTSQIKTLLHKLEVNNIPFVIEANDDLMGIFNLDAFKRAYRYWKAFLISNEDSDKLTRWNQIIAETSYAFYKKKQEVVNFIGDSSSYLNPQKIADFICGNKSLDRKKEIIDYFEGLVRLKNKKSVSMENIIKNFLGFPLVRNQLTKDEIKWIEKETEQFQSWEGMVKRYQELNQKKEEMKKKLDEYHKGTFNAIYLLTIHKSKGLSFKNVFLIGLYDEGLPSNKATKVTPEIIQESIEKAEPPTTIEEERRLMYGAKRWFEIV
ncbi:ATP-dependent helicase [Bacillus sp. CCB-MMP212]|uniref:ATP-dependent helicase n=1 Tax=Bacillus sp. CCB-MMP212 TaxID=2928002 RepID=UPI001F61B721|nr:ATP-dependent helicase [Bacillus sp. CCB-MMP212]MCI4251552.1 ATP-dependent helicase [Bacillus sp. CCB-MMP212]